MTDYKEVMDKLRSGGYLVERPCATTYSDDFVKDPTKSVEWNKKWLEDYRSSQKKAWSDYVEKHSDAFRRFRTDLCQVISHVSGLDERGALDLFMRAVAMSNGDHVRLIESAASLTGRKV